VKIPVRFRHLAPIRGGIELVSTGIAAEDAATRRLIADALLATISQTPCAHPPPRHTHHDQVPPSRGTPRIGMQEES